MAIYISVLILNKYWGEIVCAFRHTIFLENIHLLVGCAIGTKYHAFIKETKNQLSADEYFFGK